MHEPKAPIRGTDVAGTIEAIGPGVTRFAPGDEVFGWAKGSYAQYAAASQDMLAPKPATLDFEQAAAVPMAGLVALQAVPASIVPIRSATLVRPFVTSATATRGGGDPNLTDDGP